MGPEVVASVRDTPGTHSSTRPQAFHTPCLRQTVLCKLPAVWDPQSLASPSSLFLSVAAAFPPAMFLLYWEVRLWVPTGWLLTGMLQGLAPTCSHPPCLWQCSSNTNDGFGQDRQSLLSLSLTMTYAWMTPSGVTPLQVPCLVAVYTLSRISPPQLRVTPWFGGHPSPSPIPLTDVVKASRCQSLRQVGRVQERGQEGHDHVLLVIQDGFIS